MRGQVFVVEALIASSILFLILFSLLSTPHSSQRDNYYTLYATHRALTSLDANGSLRNITLLNDTKTLERLLENLVQRKVFVTFFSADGNLTPLPQFSRKISSVSYYISGDFNCTLPREIRVYVIE